MVPLSAPAVARARVGDLCVTATLACELFRLNRLLTATVLRTLPDEAFERIGQHSETGQKTLKKLIQGYIDHLDGHLKHLHEKRKLLGK